MRKNDTVWRWIVFGLFAIPLPLITYFYLVLHVGFDLPLSELAVPAAIFCALVPAFAAGAYWGTRARARGDGRLIALVVGLFVLLCGFEITYFEAKLGSSAKTDGSYRFTVVFALIGTVGGYLLDKWIRSRNHNGAES